MRQNFLTKMYDGQSEVSGYSQPHEVKGYSLQLCPKCNGQGIVAKPPYVPGDVSEWSATTIANYVCNVCNGVKVISIPIPDVKGYSLQQVSDAWDAGAKYTYLADSVFETVPNKEQYLSNLTPAPDVKEVAVAFAEWLLSEHASFNGFGGWNMKRYNVNLYGSSSEDIFNYWYTNIYPQSKK